LKWDPLHNSPLREAVTALAQPADDTAAPAMIGASPSAGYPGRADTSSGSALRLGAAAGAHL